MSRAALIRRLAPGALRAVPRALRRLRSEERGVTVVIVATGMVALIAMTAFTLDVARYMELRRQLQNAVDAAAHAGATELPDVGQATTTAEWYFDQNMPSLGEATFTVSFPDGGASRVRLEGEAEIDFLFGRVLGLVTMSVNAHAEVSQDGQAADIALALDFTGSMGPNDMTALVDSATAFVDVIDDIQGGGDGDLDPSAMALITFPEWDPNANDTVSRAGVVVPLTFSESQILWGIDGDDTAGQTGPGGYGTAIGDAIAAATASLSGSLNRKVMVVMTDGQNTTGQDPLGAADAAVAAGIQIYTIGLGDSVNEALLEDIAATGSGSYIFAPTYLELEAAFEAVARQIRISFIE